MENGTPHRSSHARLRPGSQGTRLSRDTGPEPSGFRHTAHARRAGGTRRARGARGARPGSAGLTTPWRQGLEACVQKERSFLYEELVWLSFSFPSCNLSLTGNMI